MLPSKYSSETRRKFFRKQVPQDGWIAIGQLLDYGRVRAHPALKVAPVGFNKSDNPRGQTSSACHSHADLLQKSPQKGQASSSITLTITSRTVRVSSTPLEIYIYSGAGMRDSRHYFELSAKAVFVISNGAYAENQITKNRSHKYAVV